MLNNLLPVCDYDWCERLATARRESLRLCPTHAAEYDRDHDDAMGPVARRFENLGERLTPAQHCDFDECEARGTEQRGQMRYCPQHASEHDTLVAEAHAAEIDAQRAAHAKRLEDAEDARLQREHASEDAARDYRTAYYNLVARVEALCDEADEVEESRVDIEVLRGVLTR